MHSPWTCLTAERPETDPSRSQVVITASGSAQHRDNGRHWIAVDLDFVVGDLAPALEHAPPLCVGQRAGAAGAGKSQPTEGSADQPQHQGPGATDYSVTRAGTTIGDGQNQPAVDYGD